MRTAALIFAGEPSAHALAPLSGGPSAYERTLAFASGLPGLVAGLVLRSPGPAYPGVAPSGDSLLRVSERPAWSVADILAEATALAARCAASPDGPLDALVLLQADEPLLDPGLAATLLGDYRRYRADYAFGDGYPVGLCVEVLHPRILPALTVLLEKHPLRLERGWLFQLIQKDINAFDVETLISPVDLREFRLVLACDSSRDKLLLERLMGAGVTDAASALATIPRRLDLLRTLPAFIQVQVSGPCPQACAFCPYPQLGGDILRRTDFLPRSTFAALAQAVARFCGDAVLDLSLWGEAALHPDIEGLLDDALGVPGLSVIVETSGLGWKPGVLESLARKHPEGLHWVVSLDAPEATLYTQLRGQGFEEAVATADRLLALFPATAYVQTLRTQESEAALEDFWRGWKKKTENVIVQKYSTFAGFLPPRKVTDLSPLTRRPCWHLKRDLSILIDGRVPLCRECARGEVILGSLWGDPSKTPTGTVSPGAEALQARLEAVWAAGEAFHSDQVGGDYHGPCKDCDEYYTYNA